MSGAVLGQAKTAKEESDTTLLIQVKPRQGSESQSLPIAVWGSQPQDNSKGSKHMAKVTPLELPDEVRGSEATQTESQYSTPKARQSTLARSRSRLSSAKASLVHLARIRMRWAMKISGWYDSNVAVATRKFLRGRSFLIVTMICLFLALFLSDLFALSEVEENVAQDVILTVVFAIFLLEFLGLVLTDASYFLGFFFFMDLLGTLSMIFDISYMLGTDVTEPERRSPDSGKENIIVVRAARATKLGARAGRLSRVLKLLRFMPFLRNEAQDQDVQMARRISSQLMNVISTRVAFLSICIVVFLPFLNMFTYPEVEDSMLAWTQLLSVNAVDYYTAITASPQDDSLVSAYHARLLRELSRFSKFYELHSYGPFEVDYGQSSGDSFVSSSWLQLNFTTSFTAPGRKSMIREVTTDNFKASFDLSTPKQLEAIANITLIVFTALTMLVFGLVTSSSISSIALNPLERMLKSVREQCREIFKYTDEFKDLQKSQEATDNDEEDYEEDDKAESSEFVLLEKVVKKLTAIAQLAVKSKEPQARENMSEDEIAAMNWGGQSANASMNARSSRIANVSVVASEEDYVEDSQLSRQLTPDEPDLPEDIINALETEFFDAFVTPEGGSYSLMAVSLRVVQHHEGSEYWVRSNVQVKHLIKFMELVECGYKPNPYHNYNHALDVLYSVARWMNLIEAHLFLTEISQFWVMIASIGHDLGHIGVNNQYLIETKDQIALKYNDRSPLENMHCATLFQIIQNDSEADIFSQVERDVYKEMRKGIIQAILHTDFTKHPEMVKELGLFYHTNYEVFDEMEPGPRFIETLSEKQQLIINMLVHGADISNPMRPWDICHKYAQLIVEEFFNQGDMEEKAGIPIQALNNRHTVNIPSSQVGFIEFLITPMAEVMVNLFAPLDGLAENLGSNIQSWQKLWITEFKPEEEAQAKVKARVEKVAKRCKAVTRAERRISNGTS